MVLLLRPAELLLVMAAEMAVKDFQAVAAPGGIQETAALVPTAVLVVLALAVPVVVAVVLMAVKALAAAGA
jgi:hypothetical protein